jgi:hypothetical protein
MWDLGSFFFMRCNPYAGGVAGLGLRAHVGLSQCATPLNMPANVFPVLAQIDHQ